MILYSALFGPPVDEVNLLATSGHPESACLLVC